jgi:hypothetical protein
MPDAAGTGGRTPAANGVGSLRADIPVPSRGWFRAIDAKLWTTQRGRHFVAIISSRRAKLGGETN